MADTRHFTLTEEHLTLLRAATITWYGDDRWGAPAVDQKRPYGNSGDWTAGIHELLGGAANVYDRDGSLPADLEERYWRLHRETEQALQILIRCGPTPGVYVASEYTDDWCREGDIIG